MNKTSILFFILIGQVFLAYNLICQENPSHTSEINIPVENLSNGIPDELKPNNASPDSESESFPVILRSFDRATLSSQVTSTIQKITHRMGESFQKGELLILLDDRVFQGLLQKGQGELAKAQAELSSKEQLFRQDIASIYELKTAQANVAMAISDIISAEHAVNACHIIAPYNGKVVQLFVEEAELIQEGKPLIEIVRDEQLIGQVLISATPKNLKALSLGKKLKIYIQEIEGFVIGQILRISPVIDPASSLIKIDILIDNRAGMLRSGMLGQATLEESNDDYYKPSVFKQPANQNRIEQ